MVMGGKGPTDSLRCLRPPFVGCASSRSLRTSSVGPYTRCDGPARAVGGHQDRSGRHGEGWGDAHQNHGDGGRACRMVDVSPPLRRPRRGASFSRSGRHDVGAVRGVESRWADDSRGMGRLPRVRHVPAPAVRPRVTPARRSPVPSPCGRTTSSTGPCEPLGCPFRR